MGIVEIYYDVKHHYVPWFGSSSEYRNIHPLSVLLMMFLRNRIKTDLKNKKQKLDFAVKMKKIFPERVYVATQKVQPPVTEFYCLSQNDTKQVELCLGQISLSIWLAVHEGD